MSSKFPEYDELDRKIAFKLSKDSTITNADLGSEIGLSSSATNERIRKLKNNNIIKYTSSFIDADFVDMSLCAFIYVLVDQTEKFLEAIAHHESILECHHITGNYSYLLKVRLKDTKALEYFITHFLKSMKFVTKTLTQIVLSTQKDHSVFID